ncbi:uracil-DNA glycosylase [Flavobacteriales bacterium 34_180_T64]|nr:uracil-DNA glycosylase [Flavobacteriales bacterium 34_180_T64]
MIFKLPQEWENRLKEETQKSYFQNLKSLIEEDYKSQLCFPPDYQIFSAFEMCAFDDVKVVILGQDPYHGLGQANGMCFSVADLQKHPPSLTNIFKEIESDLGQPKPISGNLERWSKQGVFLLNATLTVKANKAGSHQNMGWETFTDAVIKYISNNKAHVVFLLWGGFAKKKSRLIDSTKHSLLVSGHPSPLSANRGYWYGNKHFSKANFLLEQAGSEPIDW